MPAADEAFENRLSGHHRKVRWNALRMFRGADGVALRAYREPIAEALKRVTAASENRVITNDPRLDVRDQAKLAEEALDWIEQQDAMLDEKTRDLDLIEETVYGG